MSIDHFDSFAELVRRRFNSLASAVQPKLFVMDLDRDKLWETYLASFPEGTNPVFRARTEHDCGCCRHFIKNIGPVVAIENGQIQTIWEGYAAPAHYQPVATAMRDFVKKHEIDNVFLYQEDSCGSSETREWTKGEQPRLIVWKHFAVQIPKFCHFSHNTTRGQLLGENRTTFDMLKRSVVDFKPEAIQTVLDLIKENNLYRGAEFQKSLEAFQQLILSLQGKSDATIWMHINSPVARLRNSVIGTLVDDLSSGVDVSRAVASYEAKVAPTNYKRPTAVVTKKMAEDAMKTIQELDLEPALARRHARLSDVSINSVLWVDGSVQGKLKGGLESLLMSSVATPAFSADKAKPISIDEFLQLKHQNGIKLYFGNDSVSHLVSLTAPVHPEVKSLFRWSNDFAWTYNGNVADSIKEKVKRAGGQVENVALRCSLAWNNFDDLDLHCECPWGHVYFNNKLGILDVDMNAGGPSSREPVENMRWSGLRDGMYAFSVHNFNRRETVDFGFMVELEFDGAVHTFSHPKPLNNHDKVAVCTVVVKNGKVSQVTHSEHVTKGGLSSEHWGLKTQSLIDVDAIVLSPNYWDDNAVGNKHWFFILRDCKNPEPCRGIYNEFLHPRLEKHRRVFELVGSKTNCPVTDEQMSGVGYSSTLNSKVYLVSNGVTYAVSF